MFFSESVTGGRDDKIDIYHFKEEIVKICGKFHGLPKYERNYRKPDGLKTGYFYFDLLFYGKNLYFYITTRTC